MEEITLMLFISIVMSIPLNLLVALIMLDVDGVDKVTLVSQEIQADL